MNFFIEFFDFALKLCDLIFCLYIFKFESHLCLRRIFAFGKQLVHFSFMFFDCYAVSMISRSTLINTSVILRF